MGPIIPHEVSYIGPENVRRGVFAPRVACRQPADVVLAVDTSTSIGRVNMVRVLAYCQSLAVGLDWRSRFAVVTFSDRARLVHNFTDQISYRTVDGLSAAYTAARSTDTAGALRLACQLLASAAVHQRRVALLVVDGRCGGVKLAFHDTDTDILAGILADTSDTRAIDFLKLFLWQAERGSRPTLRHPRRHPREDRREMSVSVSVSASWNASLNTRVT